MLIPSWRPDHPFELAVAPYTSDSAIQLWDIREPNLPQGTLLGHPVRLL